MKCTLSPKMNPASPILFPSTAHSRAIVKTPSNPSELPLVLIVATIGFHSQMAAKAPALSTLMPRCFVSTLTISHPASRSASAKTTFPKEKSRGVAVGTSIQASRGV